MNENRKLIAKLIPYINSSNPIRRKGIINMIRNIMLDDFYWDKLVDNVDKDGYLKEIINRVCANLNGSHLIQNKVVDPMVYSLKKEREKDLEVIAISMDLILIITKYQTGRVVLRDMNVYCVVRDMHMGMLSVSNVRSRDGKDSSAGDSGRNRRCCDAPDGGGGRPHQEGGTRCGGNNGGKEGGDERRR